MIARDWRRAYSGVEVQWMRYLVPVETFAARASLCATKGPTLMRMMWNDEVL